MIKLRVIYGSGQRIHKEGTITIVDPARLDGWGNVFKIVSYAVGKLVYDSLRLEYNFQGSRGFEVVRGGDNGVWEVKSSNGVGEWARATDLSFKLPAAKKKSKVDQPYYAMLKSRDQHKIR